MNSEQSFYKQRVKLAEFFSYLSKGHSKDSAEINLDLLTEEMNLKIVKKAFKMVTAAEDWGIEKEITRLREKELKTQSLLSDLAKLEGENDQLKEKLGRNSILLKELQENDQRDEEESSKDSGAQ